MKLFKSGLLVLISILGAFALLVVAQVIHTGETINALWLIVAAACFYIIAYLEPAPEAEN